MKDKWFYSAQKEVSELLNSKFDEYQCNFQDVKKERVYESFTCYKNGNPFILLVLFTKKYGKNEANFEIFSPYTLWKDKNNG